MPRTHIPYLYRPPELQGGVASRRFPWEFNQEQLMKGIHVEMEHTGNIYVAMLIAMDHLAEIPNYYDLLALIEKHLAK